MTQLKGLVEFYRMGEAGEVALQEYFSRPVDLVSDRDVSFDYGGRKIELRAGKPYRTTLGMAYSLLGDPFARGEFRQHIYNVCRYRFGVHDVPIDLRDVERYEKLAAYRGIPVSPPRKEELPYIEVYDGETGDPIVAAWPLYHPEDPELPEPQTVEERLASLEAQLAEGAQAKRKRRETAEE
jgi:hypothetical protein